MTEPSPVQFLDTPSSRVQDFNVNLSVPTVGWLDIEIVIDGQSFAFPTSYVFDPYPGLRAWLEAIVRNETAQMDIDPEGWEVHLLVDDAANDQVRFGVIFEHTGPGQEHTHKVSFTVNGEAYTREYMCDIVVARKDLVRAFYRAFTGSWGAPENDRFWDEWYNTSREICEQDGEPYGADRYQMTSNLIETYLAN